MSKAIKAVCVKAHFRKYNYSALKALFTAIAQMSDKLKETLVALFGHDHFAHVFPFEGNIAANQYKIVLADHFYPTMKYFYPNDTVLFQMKLSLYMEQEG